MVVIGGCRCDCSGPGCASSFLPAVGVAVVADVVAVVAIVVLAL